MINSIKNQNYIIIILFFILSLILLEGFLCRPLIDPTWHIECYLENAPFLCKFEFCKKYFFTNFWLENGFVENLQIILLVLSIYLLFKVKNLFLENKFIYIFLVIKIFALIYYLGEEISWGQHFFKWASPDWFIENNKQNETNIHNVTNVFDKLPRTLVLIWCTIVPILTFALIKIRAIDGKKVKILLPNDKLIFFAIITLCFVLPDLIVDKFNLHPMDISSDVVSNTNWAPKSKGYIYDMLTFNFLKLSELHELLFCYYFFFYTLTIKEMKEILKN